MRRLNRRLERLQHGLQPRYRLTLASVLQDLLADLSDEELELATDGISAIMLGGPTTTAHEFILDRLDALVEEQCRALGSDSLRELREFRAAWRPLFRVEDGH